MGVLTKKDLVFFVIMSIYQIGILLCAPRFTIPHVCDPCEPFGYLVILFFTFLQVLYTGIGFSRYISAVSDMTILDKYLRKPLIRTPFPPSDLHGDD